MVACVPEAGRALWGDGVDLGAHQCVATGRCSVAGVLRQEKQPGDDGDREALILNSLIQRLALTLEVYDGALQKASKQRTEDERFAVYVQSLFGWLTSYIHDDEESIKGCEMGRPTANQALGAVAGLLHRLAHDHTAASV